MIEDITFFLCIDSKKELDTRAKLLMKEAESPPPPRRLQVQQLRPQVQVLGRAKVHLHLRRNALNRPNRG